MAGTFTTIDHAIDVLISIVSGLPAFTGVQVIDGWSVREDDVFIAIAYGEEAVAGTQEAAATGAARDEDYDIKCMISVRVGGYQNAEQAAARTQAFTLLRALEAAIRGVAATPADATLPVGGMATVMFAELASVAYRTTLTSTAPGGRWADVLFVVRIQNYLY